MRGIDLINGSPLFALSPFLLYVFIFWELFWKGIALWKTGRHNQMGWFIAILLVNSLGILPIIYLLFFQKSGRIISSKKHKKRK
ncbi:MAG: DUF5652 family protein [Nanoarchaeota archaeon]|nr:DUF5652 family protein [Nanoarchaeota archaeon]